MSDFGDVGGIVGGSAGLAVLAKYLWEQVTQRKAKLEADAESRAEVKLDKLVDGLARLELELRDLRNSIATQAGTVEQIDRRVQGLSGDYGPRLKELELWRAQVQARGGRR